MPLQRPTVHRQSRRHSGSRCEDAPEVAPFDTLLRAGLTLPPADALDDSSLAARVWEMIRGLEEAVNLSSLDHENVPGAGLEFLTVDAPENSAFPHELDFIARMSGPGTVQSL